MKKSVKVALGGVVAALSLVLMFLTSIVPFGTYAFPTFAGIFLVIIVINLGCGYAAAVYFVTAVLSFLLVTDKEAALYYTAFLGFYPIVKSVIERIPNRVIQYVLKFSLFNACIIAAFCFGIAVLNIPIESFQLFGVFLPWVFLLIANAFFLLYDLCITRLVTLYLLKWHHLINKNTKL